MPIDVLEQHPFLNYRNDFIPPSQVKYKSLIVGSFPIYAITNSLDETFNVIAERFDIDQTKVRFFYGSKKSDFWKLVAEAHLENDPTETPAPIDYNLRKQNCIDFLERNKILITDSVYRTNRENECSEDTNLWIEANNFASQNCQTNENILQLLENHPTIDSLFFTSTMIDAHSPYGWFCQSINGELNEQANWQVNGGRSWFSEITIQERIYNAFLLPTPKTRGIHFTDDQRLPMFVNYLQSYVPQFYAEVQNVLVVNRTQAQKNRLTELRYSFLVECYRQALIHRNRNFNGTMP